MADHEETKKNHVEANRIPEPMALSGAEIRLAMLIEEIEKAKAARELQIVPLTREEMLAVRRLLQWQESVYALSRFKAPTWQVIRWGGFVVAAYLAWKTGALTAFITNWGKM